MQKIKENDQLNNKGFTLIEMIVTVSIIAIFAGVVLNFIATGSNLFRNTSSSAKVQMEIQETFDKIEDMIINANRNLSYGESSHVFEVSSFDEKIAEKSGTLKKVKSAVVSDSDDENVRDYIIWNQSTEEISYIHSEKLDNTWRNSNTSSSNPRGDILATGITYFQADISRVISDHIVNFTLKTKKGTKEVKTVHSVSLRNNLNFNYTPDEPFDNPTIDPDPDNPNPDNSVTDPDEPKPVSLLANKKKILIAAGTSYDLGSNIEWKVCYNNAATASAGSLSWSVSNCTYASISSDGVISVDKDAGTVDTGTVTIIVTDKDHNDVWGTLTVSIARIDMTLPKKNATYQVGNAKQLQYTYMEGGTVGTGATIITEQKPDGASAYSAEGKFVQNDIGDWKVKASVNLSARIGYDIAYGIVEDTNTFSVIDSATDIVVNGDSTIDALVAGREYVCMPTIKYGFNWRPATDDILWHQDARMRWGIKGNTAGISIDSTDYAYPSTERHIEINDDVQHGFIIYADFYKDNGDGTSITFHAEKEIKVVNGISLSALNGDTAYAYENGDPLYSEGYEMNLLLNVYDVDGNNIPLLVSKEDGTTVDWSGLGSESKIEASTDQKNWIFMPGTHNVDKTLEINATIQRMASKYGIFDRDNNYKFNSSISVKVVEPELTARIIPEGDEIIEPGETKELYCELLDKDDNAVKRTVTWSVKDGTTGHLSESNTDTGVNQLTVFSADKPGTYMITAAYDTVQNRQHYITKKITVRKPEVELTLHGPENGYNGDTNTYWLEAKIDKKDAADLQVTWTTDWAGKLNKATSKTGNNDAVWVAFDANAGSCKITASVRVAGEDIEVSKNITLKQHEYTMTVTVVDPTTNQTINSCVPEQTIKFVVRVYCDENEVNDCQINWETWGKKFNISGNTATYTTGKDENSLSFQIQAVSGSKTQNAQVKFDKDGIVFTSKW